MRGDADSLGRNILRFLGDFARFGRSRILAAVGLVAIGAVVEGVSVLLLVPFFGLVIGDLSAGGALGTMVSKVAGLLPRGSPFALMLVLLGAFAALMIARGIVIVLRDVRLARLQTEFVAFQRMRLAQALALADWQSVSRLSHARFSQFMMGDIQRCGAAAHFVLQSGVASLVLLAYLGVTFALSPPIALLGLLLVALSSFMLFPALRHASATGEASTGLDLALTRDTRQFLGALKQAFSHNEQSVFVDELRHDLDQLTARRLDFVRQQAWAKVASSLLGGSLGAAALLIGYWQLDLAPAVLITLLVVLARIGGPVIQIQQGALQLANSLPAYLAIAELLAELPAASARSAEGSATRLGGPPPIRFERVTYGHADNGDGSPRKGIRDVDLVIEPGEFLGLTGPSGAGKTTLIDLLVGLHAPQSGSVVIGDMNAIDLDAWRDAIAYVPQDPFLFYESIRRNLVWGLHRSDGEQDDDIWQALAAVGADDLVGGLRAGLESIVGERGTLLSGGERQRLAIARALLRKPALLLLDEGTSAIDVASEQNLLGRVRHLLPAATIILVAHRQESLALCDRVLVLEEGRIVGGDGPRRIPSVVGGGTQAR